MDWLAKIILEIRHGMILTLKIKKNYLKTTPLERFGSTKMGVCNNKDEKNQKDLHVSNSKMILERGYNIGVILLLRCAGGPAHLAIPKRLAEIGVPHPHAKNNGSISFL